MRKKALLDLGYGVLLLVMAWGAGTALSSARRLYAPLEGEGLWRKAREAMQQEKPREALKSLRELLRHDPDNPVYLCLQGDALRSLEKWEAEAEIGERILRTPAPRCGCPHLTLPYEKLGLFDKAMTASERCAEIDPDNTTGLYNFAIFLERRGMLDRAEKEYVRLERSPSFLGARLARARVRLQKGDPAAAEKIVLRTLRERPGLPAALMIGAAAAKALGDRELSSERWTAFQKTQPPGGGRAGAAPYMNIEGNLEPLR